MVMRDNNEGEGNVFVLKDRATSQSRAAVMTVETDDDASNDAERTSITVHLWLAELITGVLEVDANNHIHRFATGALYQPGVRPLFRCVHCSMSHGALHTFVPCRLHGCLRSAFVSN